MRLFEIEKVSEGVEEDTKALINIAIGEIENRLGGEIPKIDGGWKLLYWDDLGTKQVWTRGDGSRYRDAPFVGTRFEKYPDEFRQEFAEKVGRSSPIEFFWEDIVKKRGKLVGQVKQGQVMRNLRRPAYKIGRLYFVKASESAVKVFTVSKLRNTPVWELD